MKKRPIFPSCRMTAQTERRQWLLSLVLLLLSISSLWALIIPRRTIPGLLKAAPIVIKGTVENTSPAGPETSAFGFEDDYSWLGSLRTAEVRVESVIKGSVTKPVVSAVYFDSAGMFTRLSKGNCYVLFLEPHDDGFQLYDPWNGAVQVAPGAGPAAIKDPTARLKQEFEMSLGSQNDLILQTALLGLAEVGDENTTGRLRPFLTHSNASIKASAISALLRLGDWRLLTNAVEMCKVATNDPSARRGLGLVTLNLQNSLDVGLGSVTNRDAVPTLLSLLSKTTQPTVRFELLKSVVACGDQRAVPVLLEFLEGSDPDASHMAYRALMRIKGESAYLGYDVFTGQRRSEEIARIREWAQKQHAHPH